MRWPKRLRHANDLAATVGESSLLIRQAFRDPHHLLVAVDDLQAAVVVVGDDQVEAVGAEVQRGVRLIRDLLALGLRIGSHAA